MATILLSRKEVFYPTSEQAQILGHMGYAAYKLFCYDSAGSSFIIWGFLKATHYCDKKISYLQSVSDRQAVSRGEKYSKKTKRELALYRKKKNRTMDFIHKATRKITDYCVENQIHTVVIGDIKGIRKDKNMGRNNQQMHALPYELIYQKLKYKLTMNGIKLIRQKEAYSSQCSPDSPEVSRKYPDSPNIMDCLHL